MPITEDRISKLWEFGFSESAARAYLALLDLGVAEAREISTLSRVPTSKIYNVLEQLHEKGLVTIFPEFPKRYSPVPFRDYLAKLRHQHEAAASSIDANLETLDRMFSIRGGSADVTDQGAFTVLRGRRNVLAKSAEITRNTERDLIVMGSHGTAERRRQYQSELAEAHAAGVKLRYLLPVDAESVEHVSPLLDVAEVRVREGDGEESSSNVAILLSDSCRALIIHFVPDDGHLYKGKDVAIYTDHRAVVSALHTLLEARWRTSVDLSVRAAELAGTRPAAFTRVLRTPEEGVHALEQALARGGTEVLGLVPQPADSIHPGWRASVLGALDRVEKCRVLLNLRESTADRRRWQDAPHGAKLEVRQLGPWTASRFVLVDDREAFISVSEPRPDSVTGSVQELGIHTSEPAVLASLREQFEDLWVRSAPPPRRVEVKAADDRQPRGAAGAFLDLVQDPALLVRPETDEVCAWNASASKLLGLGTPEPPRPTLALLLPDLAGQGPDATAYSRPVTVPAGGGASLDLDVVARPVPGEPRPGSGGLLVLVLKPRAKQAVEPLDAPGADH